MSIRMISKKDHSYGGKQLRAGDEFTVPGESQRNLFVAIGRAEVAATQPEPVKSSASTPARKTAAKKTVAAKKAAPTYHRRDMTAEQPAESTRPQWPFGTPKTDAE